MKKYLCAAAILVLINLILLSGVKAVELTADVIMKSKNGESVSKIYLKAGKFRADMLNQSGYHIIRQDRHVMWIVLPESKTYMEIRCTQGEKPAQENIPGEIDRSNMGTEMIDGHPTIKYKITYQDNNHLNVIYQWLALDINFPVKVSASDGSWSNEYKNINLSPVSDTLFEIPDGYERLQLPETTA